MGPRAKSLGNPDLECWHEVGSTCGQIWRRSYYNVSLTFVLFSKTRGRRWRGWLRNCATSRKVAGSITDGVIGVFHWRNPSGRDSSSNRNEYQEYLLGRKGGRCVVLTTLPPSCADCLEILGASTSWNPQSLCRPVQGLLKLFLTKNGIPLHLRIKASQE
jgi:hypothetical protein